MRHNSNQHDSGYIVLITVLIVGIVATTVALFTLITGTNTTITSAGVEASTEARAGALACAELALEEIQANPGLVTPATNSSTIDTTTHESCDYQTTGSTPNYTIIATGTGLRNADNYVHNLTISTDQVSPKVHIASWLDTP